MKPIHFAQLTKEVEIVDTMKSVRLSARRKQEIEDYWKEINMQESFHRGEVFHVDAITEEKSKYKIKLKRTDYAHYLHTIRKCVTDAEGCRVIFGAALIETKDEKFVFGEMANHTVHPGRLQCVGGGLGSEDKKGNHFDMEKSVLRELHEELAVEQQHIATCVPVYLKSGGTFDSLVVLHHIKLKITEAELRKLYKSFVDELLSKGEKPEFQHVIYLEKDKGVVHQFFEEDDRKCEDYLKPFIKRMIMK